MKKLLLGISVLLVTPYCNAADHQSWDHAVSAALKKNQRIEEQTALKLRNTMITQIPEDITLPYLERLLLNSNRIERLNPETLLQQFPELEYLDVSDNPLDPENIDDLRSAAQKVNRKIDIIANNINPPRPEGENIKGD